MAKLDKKLFGNGQAQCAWCGGFHTRFQYFRCWDEDERGNAYETDDLDDPDHAPRDAIWFCATCGDDFIEPLPGKDYPTFPEDFIIPE